MKTTVTVDMEQHGSNVVHVEIGPVEIDDGPGIIEGFMDNVRVAVKGTQKNVLQTLQDNVSEWSDATFGPGQRTEGMIAHLALEVQELKESPESIKEYADCFMLLIDVAGSVGFNMDDLVRATFDKLEVNKKRKWGPTNEDGSVEHVREK